jgi:hypothetical protein
VYSNSSKDIEATLRSMEHSARVRSNFNQSEAKRLLVETIKLDRRFDGLNPVELARRVQQSRQDGSVLDLQDCYDPRWLPR